MGMIDKIDALNDKSQIANCVDIARKTCQLLLFLTYDITDYSQLEANKLKTNPRRVQIHETLKEVAELLSFNFKNKGLICNIVVENSVPGFLLIDDHRYMQILLNIMTNALKFTFKGSITIKASYDASGNLLVTSVIDTGIGIKAEEIPHLFKIFGKLESTSDINPQGVGFGLAMCKKLSERLGGSISVHSVPNAGSTFTFSVNARLCYSKASSYSSTNMNENPPNFVELPVKIAEHTFSISHFKTDRQTEFKGSPSYTNRNLMGMTQTNCIPVLSGTKCNCNKILIMDDDYCNLLVLQNYLQQNNLTADEAIPSLI
eukprot:TRINITY_DN5489_c0_g1_i1.p1 TRINITY_DN5489_c0_g1~~TRINITY_DN5489_c0_g1_i1.p1  ORF type:complete len:317 (+),score=72.15 TRINITY_DN5489_c0_g1_i1:628-1578(+)